MWQESLLFKNEWVDEKGRVKSIAADQYYPGIQTMVFSPKYYYKVEHQDAYSLKILKAKKRSDFSDFFWPEIKGLVEDYKEEIRTKECDFITVVPTSKELLTITPTMHSLAMRLSEHLKIPYRPVLVRGSFKRAEAPRNRQNRYAVVNGSVSVKSFPLNAKRVILLDDNRGTGMSILECTKILMAAGVKSVTALCLGTNTSQKPKIEG